MHYNITKKITAKRESSYLVLLSYLILLIAIPVIVIALLSNLVIAIFSFIYIKIKGLIRKESLAAPVAPYYLEYVLLDNQYIKIIAVEDEADTELTALNEAWSEEVYQAETYLYRAKTSPLIPALENSIICFFAKEQPGGALLQIADKSQNTFPSSTQLVFLQYNTLQIVPIEPLGSFYLYNDEKNNNLIRGFNTGEKLCLYLT